MQTMKNRAIVSSLFPRQFAVLILATAIGIPAWAQQQAQPTGDSQTAAPSASQQPSPEATTYVPPPKEGFWGHLNPFARKKWVKKQIDPINDRLTELDQLNAKNARDIQDVDNRAQAGIHQAQSTADQANQTATAAGTQAQQANSTAEQASNHVAQLNTTVSGLDQYHQVTSFDVAFHGGNPALNSAAREQLDSLASTVTGHDGYILQLEAHSPLAGSAGIQSSQRLAESVERYLVTEHQIPIYRMRFVALGNAPMADATDADGRTERVRTSTVHVQLMENSLAAQAAASPQGAASLNGAERQ